jgi:hypothetical protein
VAAADAGAGAAPQAKAAPFKKPKGFDAYMLLTALLVPLVRATSSHLDDLRHTRHSGARQRHDRAL